MSETNGKVKREIYKESLKERLNYEMEVAKTIQAVIAAERYRMTKGGKRSVWRKMMVEVEKMRMNLLRLDPNLAQTNHTWGVDCSFVDWRKWKPEKPAKPTTDDSYQTLEPLGEDE